MTAFKPNRADSQWRVRAYREEVQEGSNGFCIGCGAPSEVEVEPDAREYRCSACHENQVYGLEELLFMGLLELEEE